MGLGAFFLSVLGGVVLFAAALAGVLYGALQLGFQAGDALWGLAVVGACLVLLLLWPLFYVVRRIRYRGRPLPPIHPDIVLPRWLTLGTRVVVVGLFLAVLGVLAVGSFFHGALMGYARTGQGSAVLGRVEFVPASRAGLSVHDVTVISSRGGRWSVAGQGADVWLVEGVAFTVDEWLRPFLAHLSVGPSVRMATLSYRAEAGTPVIRCRDLGAQGVIESVLERVAPVVPGFHLDRVLTTPVKPGEAGGRFRVIYDSRGLALVPDGAPGAAATSPSSPPSSPTTPAAGTSGGDEGLDMDFPDDPDDGSSS